MVRQGHPRLGPDGGPDLIVDDDGDATLLIHEGIKAKELYEKTDELPDPNSTDNVEFQIVLTIIRDRLKTDPTRNHKMKERFVGVYEETTTGVKRLCQMQANETLLFPVINVSFSPDLVPFFVLKCRIEFRTVIFGWVLCHW